MIPSINDANAHILAIEAAMRGLQRFHDLTCEPAPIPHQLVGTVVDNTILLLTAPINSLDGVPRIAFPSEWNTWKSAMQAVHRSFFSSLHMSVEKGLSFLCDENKILVKSKQGEKFVIIAERVRNNFSPDQNAHEDVEKMIKHFKSYRKGFNDYLEAILSNTAITKEEKKNWRIFFSSLSIIRNKTSHFEQTLSDTEREKLSSAGLGEQISADGILILNPALYSKFIDRCLSFFEVATSSLQKARNTYGES